MNTKISPYDHLNGFYRPGLSFPEQLFSTTVGRKELLDNLEIKLATKDFDDEKRNFMIMGPPGSGKTHFIRILGQLVQQKESLNEHYEVIQFPEENHRILTFADLLLGVTEILGHSLNQKKLTELVTELESLEDDSKLIELAIPKLEQFCKSRKKHLLILLENIDVFFRGQLRDNKNVKQFRKFITKSSFATFVGTSKYNLIKTDELRKSPFNLFDIDILDVLNGEQTVELIRKHLEWDNREELLETFDELVPRVNALYEMSGGNPRLSLILYELIVKENKWDIKRQIEKLLDLSTPFFRDRMHSLAPQERALLETIALVRIEAKTATSIAKFMRQSLQQTSNHLNKLLKAGYLVVGEHPSDKRSKIYRIKEGFFGLWLAIGHSREQNIILPRLVEFLELWYSEKSGRERKRLQIWSLLKSVDTSLGRSERNNQEQLLKYLSDIGDAEEIAQSKFELVHYFLLANEKTEAKRLLKGIYQNNFEKPDYFNWMLKQCKNWINQGIEPIILQLMEDIIENWRLQKTEEFQLLADSALKLANGFFANGYFELMRSFMDDVLRYIADNEWRIRLLERVAISHEKLKQWNEAIQAWNQVLETAKKARDIKSQGTVLNNIAQIYQDLGERDAALDHLNRSLEVLNKIKDYAGQGTTLNNIATIHFEQGYYEKALECLEHALSVVKISRNLYIEGVTLSNISLIFQARQDYDRALEFLNRSLANMRRIGNRESECVTLNNISQIYLETGETDKMFDAIRDAYTIAYEDDNVPYICLSLYNRGKAYWHVNKQNEAMMDWVTCYKLATDERLDEILRKLFHLAESIGKNGSTFWKKQLKEAMNGNKHALSSGY